MILIKKGWFILILNYSEEKIETIFLTNNTTQIPKQDFNIILSPSFYWTKIKKIPVYTTYQAKEYAKSLFEGQLLQDDYNYFVKKIRNNEFRFFAYSPTKIKELIKNKDAEIKNIQKIYFAQNEFESWFNETTHKAIDTNDGSYLTTIKNNIVLVPSLIEKNIIKIDEVIDQIQLSKNYITFGSGFGINKIGKKGLAIAVVASIVLMIGMTINIISNITKINKISNSLEKKLNKLNLPKTSFELKAMANESKQKVEKQLKIRENIKKLSSLDRTQYGKIEKITITSKEVLVYDK